MAKDWKHWQERVSVKVLSMDEGLLVVEVNDMGTRRSPKTTAGRMTLYRHEHGHWTVNYKDRASWADDDLRAWCKRVGGGVQRSVGLVKAAQAAAHTHELAKLMNPKHSR